MSSVLCYWSFDLPYRELDIMTACAVKFRNKNNWEQTVDLYSPSSSGIYFRSHVGDKHRFEKKERKSTTTLRIPRL